MRRHGGPDVGQQRAKLRATRAGNHDVVEGGEELLMIPHLVLDICRIERRAAELTQRVAILR